ncbi:MAG: acyl-CoA dehydrogenase [Burkholderiales bacterium]
MNDTPASAAARTNSVSEQHQMLRASVEAFLTRESSLARCRALHGQRLDYDRSFWQKLAAQGWVGIRVPEALGGVALGMTELCVVAQALGRALVPEPFTAVSALVCSILTKSDNASLTSQLLPQLARGDLIAAAAWQEDLDGTESIEATAARVLPAPRGLRLSGAKRFVTPARADGYIVSATESNALALYWVPAVTEGIAVELEMRADGTHSATVRFNEVAVEPHQCLARGARAREALSAALDEAVLVASAELLGGSERAFELTLDYLRTRVQFGRPIGSFQALQHRAVDLFIQNALASAALDEATRTFDGDVDPRTRSLVASRLKSRCSDAALSIGRECIRFHGAIGFADESDIGLYYQRALVLAAWLGNGAEHRRRVSALTIDDMNAAPSKAAAAKGGVRRSVADASNELPADADWNAMDDPAFRAMVRREFEEHYPDGLRYLIRRARWSETRDWALRMSRRGWIAPLWPREHGGMGLSPTKAIIYMEEQERWGIARAPDMGIVMLGPLLIRFGTEEQRETYLPKIIACEHVWAQGYSEPNAGSDLASLRTEAVIDGDEFVVNGSKIWSTLAQDATHMFMLVRTDKNARKKQEGISFVVLDLATPGVRIRPIRNIAGHEEFCEVFFDEVRVPRKNLVGELNQGWTVAKALLGFERLNHGMPRRALYPLLKVESVARARGMWRNDEFRSKYVKLRLDVEDLASAYSRYADIVRSGRNPGPDISFLKIWATETYMRLSELLVEVAGAAGCLRGELDFGGDPVDLLGPVYGVFPATIAGGSSEILRNIIARRVLDLPS